MSRFAKMILLASLVFGFFAVAVPDDAEAGRRCWRGRSYVSSCYTPYRPYCPPAIYAPIYTPSYYCGYGGYYGGYYSGYADYGYYGYGYNNGLYCGYGFPGRYGQFNW